jgi:hypothetical protein
VAGIIMSSTFSFAGVRRSLESTPAALGALLRPLPPDLLHVNEGPDTWSPFQIVCHLAWGECDDWVPRAKRILTDGDSVPFAPFDREHGFERYAGWSLDALLEEFARLRRESLAEIDRIQLGSAQLARQGRHPELGRVTLEQLLATWVTHDYAHVAQIARVLTRHHGQFVGPWRRYFSLLK